MRSPHYLSVSAAAVILILVLTATEAEAIRLDAETRASVGSSSSNPMLVNKPTENTHVPEDSTGSVMSETKGGAVAVKEVRAVADKLPEFHEDYYGPSDHSPRHH